MILEIRKKSEWKGQFETDEYIIYPLSKKQINKKIQNILSTKKYSHTHTNIFIILNTLPTIPKQNLPN